MSVSYGTGVLIRQALIFDPHYCLTLHFSGIFLISFVYLGAQSCTQPPLRCSPIFSVLAYVLRASTCMSSRCTLLSNIR